jgi:hypothetical protein
LTLIIVYGVRILTGFYGIQAKILDKIEELKKELRETGNNKSYDPIIDKINKISAEIKKHGEPYFMSKKYIDASLKTLKSINNGIFVLRRNSDLTMEEVYSIVRDVLASLREYIQVVKSEKLKSALFFESPIFTAFIVYFIGLIYDLVLSSPILDEAVPTLISLAAILIIRRKLSYSYLLVLIASVFHLLAIPYSSITLMESYLIIIDILIILSATSYFQLVRSVRSRSFKDKIESFIKEFEEIDAKLRQPTEKVENKMMLAELEEKALRIFRQYYGDEGEALLKYKLNVMVMHGKTMEAALKEIIRNLTGKESNNKNIMV